jgi:ABC-type phosphate transport system substrate-binding protein
MTAKSMPAFLSLFALVLLAQVAPTRHDAALAQTKATEIHIEGAGSTTASPLFQAWIDEYHRLHPQIRLSYQAIGSHGGTRQLLAGNHPSPQPTCRYRTPSWRSLEGKSWLFPWR